MFNKIILTLLLSFNFLFSETAKGQNSHDTTFLRLFKNISDYYGNVFLNSSYSKTDTSQLRKMYPTELTDELELIKSYKMKLIDFDVENINPMTLRLKTVKEFYKERRFQVNLSTEDSIVLAKSDSVHASISRYISNENVYDSLQRVENLLLRSTFDQIFRDRSSKGEPKHMTILSIFETEKMYLFIYNFMMLQGYPHYYIKSDLVLK